MLLRGSSPAPVPLGTLLPNRMISIVRCSVSAGVGFALLAIAAPVTRSVAAEAEVDFARDVQPLLARRCFSCHGPDTAEGGLRLHDRDLALQALDSGEHGIVPGKPESSEVLARVSAEDADMRMPPEGKPLTAAEVDILSRWIAEGAKYQKHWAFEKVVRPAVPAVKNQAWVKSPIDAFILSKLEAKKLQPAGPASKAVLLRRLYYDLTGLPPTAAEVAAFEADTSADAYEKVVDRLLESPRYGERWARHWLDVVRYADTNSFERDGLKPHAWRYRDYVIRSFNDDKPYDQFLREQLAGDELPNPSADALIATGFYRLGLWDDEPADRELALFDGYDDLVTTVGQGMLGMTINCARCHDHKIDPIPQKDYYAMVSFFRGITPMAYGGPNVERPVFENAGAKKAYDDAVTEIKRRQEDMQAKVTEIEKEFLQKYIPEAASDLEELTYRYYLEGFERLPDYDSLKPKATGKVASNLFDLVMATRDNHFGVVFTGFLKVPQAGEYTFVIDADDGIRLTIDGKQIAIRDGIHGIGDPQTAKVTLPAGRLPVRLDYFQAHGGQGLIATWSGPGFQNRSLSAIGNDQHISARRRNRNKAGSESTPQLIQLHGEKVLGKVRAGQYTEYREQLEKLKKEKPDVSMALVVTEHPKTPDTFVLGRGSPLAPGEKVEPAFAEVLGGGAAEVSAITAGSPSSGRRTALANWIASAENPMTAKVMVNRIWQHHFGRGIVRSPNNFGLLGDMPTHPQLLNYLADEFVKHGWRMKPLHKQIVMSSAYQMSSTGNADALTVDPGNDLFWRYNMRRLGAEELRDSVFAANGRLNLKMFGPGYYPTMSKEVLETQSAPGSGWGKTSSEEQARRSIYIHVKRSLVTPLLSAFDFPDTDTTCEARFNTTQPGQALAMLNGDFMNEEALALAERVKKEAGPDLKARVAHALQITLTRKPSQAEIDRGLALINRLQTEHKQSAEDAFKHYCLYVYNLNEFVYLD